MAVTTVIPSADKALLAAQASAGPAGVDAYEAAKRELAAQQASAVAQAQTEAQRRGSPTAALSAASGAASGMYDQRMASLTEAGGIAAAQGAMREQRMVDYSGAVNQARGLIADQAAQAVAPINAETDFRIRSLERQGQNDVDKIEAQMRLDAARAAAAAAASRGGGGGGRGGGGGGGGGGGSLPKPNATELRSAMAKRSKDKMGAAIGTAQQAMRQTGEQQRQAASYTGQSANYALRQAMERNASDRPFGAPASVRAAEQARQAASYTGRSVQEARGGLLGGSGASIGQPGRSYPAAINSDPQIAAVAAAYERTARSAREAIAQQGRRSPERANPLARSLAQGIAPLYFDDNASMFTPQQIEQFAASPDAALYSYLLPEGGGAVRRIRGVDERLGGAPQYADQGSFRLSEMARDGEVDDLSRSAMRDAMMLSAFDMQDEGYEIDDNEILAALDDDSTWKAGSTYADVVGRSTARGDTADQQKAVDEANERYLRDDERDRKNDDAATEEELTAAAELDRQTFADVTGLDPGRYSQFRPEALARMAPDVQNGINVALEREVRDRDDLIEVLAEFDYSLSSPLDRAIIDMIAESLNV